MDWKLKYKGNSDVIRDSNYIWRENIEGELIEGKEYDVLGGLCMQWVYIKKEDKVVKDLTSSRYLYIKVMNEFGEEIYVWREFFES